MNPLLSALSRYVRLPQRSRCHKSPAWKRHGQRLHVERLEERALLTAPVQVFLLVGQSKNLSGKLCQFFHGIRLVGEFRYFGVCVRP
jgi:hypothetical protein